jgi:formamidopyrimidine-DNA glycosylase
MPELPEVETVARDLRPLLVGATIVGSRCYWARTLRTHEPADFGASVAGRTILSVGRRAKLIVIELSGDAALTIHLKMTGQLFVVPAAAPEDPYVRLVVVLADGRELRFRDIRKFGKVGLYGRDAASGELVNEPGGAAVFAEFGPEPLDDAFTVRAFRSCLRRRSGRLKPLLLDQSFVAGIGNIYADEALWHARLHPLRTAGTLRVADERRLHDAIRAILAEAVEQRGSSVDDYTAPDGDGSMQERLEVYQRTGEPCRRCGRPIRRLVVGARSTHLCTWCQRLPRGDRAGARAVLRTLSRDDVRNGPRWTELTTGEGSADPAAQGEPGATGAAARADRTARTRRAAATRRAAGDSNGTADHVVPSLELRPVSKQSSGKQPEPGRLGNAHRRQRVDPCPRLRATTGHGRHDERDDGEREEDAGHDGRPLPPRC